MEGLDDIQKTFLIRVPFSFRVLSRQILMEMVKTVTEARSESQSVENRVEEAGVSEICETCHARAAGPRVGPDPAVHIFTRVALTSSANRLVSFNN